MTIPEWNLVHKMVPQSQQCAVVLAVSWRGGLDVYMSGELAVGIRSKVRVILCNAIDVYMCGA